MPVVKAARGGLRRARRRRGGRARQAIAAVESWRASGVVAVAEARWRLPRGAGRARRAAPRRRAGPWRTVETDQVGGVCREVCVPGAVDAPTERAAAALAARVADAPRGRRACSPSSCSTPPTGCSSTRSRVVRTTRATGRWRARSHPSSRTTCAPSSTCRSAPPTSWRPRSATVNVFGGPRRCDRRLARRRARRADAKLHLYGKAPRPGRKLGHVTVVRDRRRRRRGARVARRRRARHARHRERGGQAMSGPLVGVVMGSASDLDVMAPARQVLAEFDVAHELHVVSAHRTPDHMLRYGHEARERGLRVLIAGAGGAAHLPGMLASVTSLPVIGVPVALERLDGLDSLLSIVQMPRGVPVATVAVNGAANAASARRADPLARATPRSPAPSTAHRAASPRRRTPGRSRSGSAVTALTARLGLGDGDAGAPRHRRRLRALPRLDHGRRSRPFVRRRHVGGAARARPVGARCRARAAELDVGVHLALTAGLPRYRWGPVTFAPSLLGGDGGFPGDGRGPARPRGSRRGAPRVPGAARACRPLRRRPHPPVGARRAHCSPPPRSSTSSRARRGDQRLPLRLPDPCRAAASATRSTTSPRSAAWSDPTACGLRDAGPVRTPRPAWPRSRRA